MILDKEKGSFPIQEDPTCCGALSLCTATIEPVL